MSALLEGDEFTRPITMTTRAPRPDEVDGVHYVFATHEAFGAASDAGELVEQAEVHGQRYGTPRAQLRQALASGRDVLLQVDVQGAMAIREAIPGTLLLFMAPGALEQLEGRLSERGADAAERARRLETARGELERAAAFDHAVVTVEGELEGTVARIREWIASERERPGRHAIEV